MYVCLYTHTGNTLAEARAGWQGLFSGGLTELRHSLSRKQKPAALIRLSGQQALGICLPPVLVLGASTAMAGSFTWVLNSNSGLHDYRVSLPAETPPQASSELSPLATSLNFASFCPHLMAFQTVGGIRKNYYSGRERKE